MDLEFTETNKFIGLGHTFESHAPDPLDWPVLWIEPTECVIPAGETVELTPEVDEVSIGPELTAVIGEELWRPSEKEAAEGITAFTISNDVSAAGEWPGYPSETTISRAYKMFPTFRPTLMEAVELSVEEARDLHIEAFIDGDQVADASMAQTRWSIGNLVREVATVMPLHPGDLVALGEPHTDETVSTSVEVTCWIEDVGELRNPIELV